MSENLLVISTVVEIVLLVAVLAVYLILITAGLRSTADTLGQVAGGLGVVQGDVELIGPGGGLLNQKLTAIGNALPAIALKAESLSK